MPGIPMNGGGRDTPANHLVDCSGNFAGDRRLAVYLGYIGISTWMVGAGVFANFVCGGRSGVNLVRLAGCCFRPNCSGGDAAGNECNFNLALPFSGAIHLVGRPEPGSSAGRGGDAG